MSSAGSGDAPQRMRPFRFGKLTKHEVIAGLGKLEEALDKQWVEGTTLKPADDGFANALRSTRRSSA